MVEESGEEKGEGVQTGKKRAMRDKSKDVVKGFELVYQIFAYGDGGIKLTCHILFVCCAFFSTGLIVGPNCYVYLPRL